MSIDEIAEQLEKSCGLSRTQADAFLEALRLHFHRELRAGRRCTLTNFGFFVPRNVPQRNILNTKNRRRYIIEAYFDVQFRPSAKLRAIVPQAKPARILKSYKREPSD